MRIANETPAANLRSVITWQYDKAENLQKLIWKKSYVEQGSDIDSPGVDLEQVGIAQRICENVTDFENRFHRYIFDAVNLALSEDVDSWGDESDDKKLVTFGLTLWSRLVGVGRPQYVSGSGQSQTTQYVKLKTWAMYIKATLFKLGMNGSLYDINRYVKILMPDIGVVVSDPSLNGDQLANTGKMTLSYSFATEDGKYVDAGSRCRSYSPYVKCGATVSISLKIGFSVNTTESKFSGISVAPILNIQDENGENTLVLGSVSQCTSHNVGSAAWYGIADITQQLPEAYRKYVLKKRVIVTSAAGSSISSLSDSSMTGMSVNISMDDPDDQGSVVIIAIDSIVTSVLDQNGNVVDYVFEDDPDPLKGLPNFLTYKARQFPEYEQILNNGKASFPYPAGVGDGSSTFVINAGNGQYLGISALEQQSTAQTFKYTLDHSVLFPEGYANPPSDAWTPASSGSSGDSESGSGSDGDEGTGSATDGDEGTDS